MGVHVVVPLSTDPPKWVQDSRTHRGLDPKTGRGSEKVGTPLLGGLVAIVLTFGAIGLFVWFCVTLAWTLATS